MMQKYEYKFDRLGEGWLAASGEAINQYQNRIHAHAREGWRLVQIFAPGIGIHGKAKFYELVLERELPS
jgi:hypothetical protein